MPSSCYTSFQDHQLTLPFALNQRCSAGPPRESSLSSASSHCLPLLLSRAPSPKDPTEFFSKFNLCPRSPLDLQCNWYLTLQVYFRHYLGISLSFPPNRTWAQGVWRKSKTKWEKWEEEAQGLLATQIKAARARRGGKPIIGLQRELQISHYS